MRRRERGRGNQEQGHSKPPSSGTAKRMFWSDHFVLISESIELLKQSGIVGIGGVGPVQIGKVTVNAGR